MTTLFGYEATLTLDLPGGPLNITHAIDLLGTSVEAGVIPIRAHAVLQAIEQHKKRCPVCGAVVTANRKAGPDG